MNNSVLAGWVEVGGQQQDVAAFMVIEADFDFGIAGRVIRVFLALKPGDPSGGGDIEGRVGPAEGGVRGRCPAAPRLPGVAPPRRKIHLPGTSRADCEQFCGTAAELGRRVIGVMAFLR